MLLVVDANILISVLLSSTKKQDKVKVFSTSDIVELLKKPKKKPESEDEAASKDESKNSAKDEIP